MILNFCHALQVMLDWANISQQYVFKSQTFYLFLIFWEVGASFPSVQFHNSCKITWTTIIIFRKGKEDRGYIKLITDIREAVWPEILEVNISDNCDTSTPG